MINNCIVILTSGERAVSIPSIQEGYFYCYREYGYAEENTTDLRETEVRRG